MIELVFSFVCLVTAHFVPEEFSSALKGCEHYPKTFRALLRYWQASGREQHDQICTLGRKFCLPRGEWTLRDKDRGRGVTSKLLQVRNAS